jgi:hypothetical protein
MPQYEKTVEAQKTAFSGDKCYTQSFAKRMRLPSALARRQLLLQNLSAPPISLTRVGEASDG